MNINKLSKLFLNLSKQAGLFQNPPILQKEIEDWVIEIIKRNLEIYLDNKKYFVPKNRQKMFYLNEDNLLGWRYFDKIKQFLPNEDFRVLVRVNYGDKNEAWFSKDDSGSCFGEIYIVINLNEPININDIKNKIHHELTHYLQYLNQFGLPSNKIRNNKKEKSSLLYNPSGYLIHPTNPKRDILFKNEPRLEHSLRDIEFYPMIQSIANKFLDENKNKSYEEIIENIKNYVNNSKFFKTLKEKNIGKWKKAVKEFYKAVKDKL
jgi:hypothetical protein